MSKTTRTGAWIYFDERRVKTDFVMISRESVTYALENIRSINTYRLWLFILHRVNGFTQDRKPEGYRLGEKEILERTGLSRSGLYRSMQELEKCGLIQREKRGKQTFAFLASHVGDANRPEKIPLASHTCDAPAALDRSQKPSDSEPVKNTPCVSPERLLPILPKINNTPSSPSEREDNKDNDYVCAEFVWFRNATKDLYLKEASALPGRSKEEAVSETWTSILCALRKKNGIDGLHNRGYAMGLTRKKSILYCWLQTMADELHDSETSLFETCMERTLERDERIKEEWTLIYEGLGCALDTPCIDGVPQLPIEGSPEFRATYAGAHSRELTASRRALWQGYGKELQDHILRSQLERTYEDKGLSWYLSASDTPTS